QPRELLPHHRDDARAVLLVERLGARVPRGRALAAPPRWWRPVTAVGPLAEPVHPSHATNMSGIAAEHDGEADPRTRSVRTAATTGPPRTPSRDPGPAPTRLFNHPVTTRAPASTVLLNRIVEDG